MNVKLENNATFRRIQAWMLRGNYYIGVKRVTNTNAAIATDVGTERSQNQDRVVIARGKDYNGDAYLLAVLCDGMGGMQDGEYCAVTTIAAFLASFFKLSQKAGMPNDWLLESANVANETIYQKYLGAGGATLSALLIKANKKVNWINIGDSRIHISSADELTQITQDDTIAGQLGKSGITSQRTSELLQYIGIGKVLEPHVSRMLIEDERLFLLTSDGVHYLPSGIISSLVSKSTDSGTCAKRLVDVAKWCGGHDNGSVAVISTTSLEDIDPRDILPGQYDIWDPFGEIQLFDSSLPAENSHTQLDKARPKKTADIKTDEPKRPRRITRRPKKDKVEAPPIIESNEFKTEKIPQLKISFPIKDD